MVAFDDEDMNLVDELPSGQWMVASFKGLLVFTSPVHAPRVLENGVMTRLNAILMPVSERG